MTRESRDALTNLERGGAAPDDRQPKAGRTDQSRDALTNAGEREGISGRSAPMTTLARRPDRYWKSDPASPTYNSGFQAELNPGVAFEETP
ncbi:hypothetical protein Q0M94_03725 [Deinococcus radiomollis]|uniref:hypothetical protein n=1 Tax=Deinococcus radiomollis TaxID=468916 RepID=UPI003891B33B